MEVKKKRLLVTDSEPKEGERERRRRKENISMEMGGEADKEKAERGGASGAPTALLAGCWR